MKFIDADSSLPLPLAQWREQGSAAPDAVLVTNDTDIEELVDALPRLSVIALQFPKWVDGRAYTQARLLRARYKFKGEIRAVGEVLVDMTPLLARTGFSAMQLRADQKREFAERALGFFDDGHYQGDTLQTHPLFARALA
jgi:uncharacterized protein (DUF934 family)